MGSIIGMSSCDQANCWLIFNSIVIDVNVQMDTISNKVMSIRDRLLRD